MGKEEIDGVLRRLLGSSHWQQRLATGCKRLFNVHALAATASSLTFPALPARRSANAYLSDVDETQMLAETFAQQRFDTGGRNSVLYLG